MKAQEAQIRAAQYELKLAHAQAIPNVSVQMVAQRDHILKYSSVSTLIAMPVVFESSRFRIARVMTLVTFGMDSGR